MSKRSQSCLGPGAANEGPLPRPRPCPPLLGGSGCPLPQSEPWLTGLRPAGRPSRKRPGSLRKDLQRGLWQQRPALLFFPQLPLRQTSSWSQAASLREPGLPARLSSGSRGAALRSSGFLAPVCNEDSVHSAVSVHKLGCKKLSFPGDSIADLYWSPEPVACGCWNTTTAIERGPHLFLDGWDTLLWGQRAEGQRAGPVLTQCHCPRWHLPATRALLSRCPPLSGQRPCWDLPVVLAVTLLGHPAVPNPSPQRAPTHMLACCPGPPLRR